MTSIKRDAIKKSWEDTEFPLVCETCLGDNPYVRMTKEPHGTKGRLKKVEICRSCAQAKNVCQVCIYDLQYGLPVKVRDKILRESGSTSGVAMNVPQSTANRAWFSAQQQRMIEQGEHQPDIHELAHAQLSDMARMEPRYERNLPKLCSFYARGECNRGANCPFRHELPRDRNDPMSQQSTKNRFFGTSDPVANKILGRKRKQDETQQQEEQEGYEKARATLYMRFQGDEPYPSLTEADVRDKFYAYGEIVSVRVQSDRGQAFVEYTQPDACALAVASMNRQSLHNRPLMVAWARAPKRGETDLGTASIAASASNSSSAAPTVLRPAAPPGGGKVNAAALPQVKAKPPPEVTAWVAGRTAPTTTSGSNAPRPTSVPRPGKPLYPSADPERLGTKST
jgi:pre-mRNA-splicing factor RBM22/SLT11